MKRDKIARAISKVMPIFIAGPVFIFFLLTYTSEAIGGEQINYFIAKSTNPTSVGITHEILVAQQVPPRIQQEWQNSSCGRGQLPDDAIIGVRLVNVHGRTLTFEVDYMVDHRHAAGQDGIQRPGPMQYINVGVTLFDANGEKVWASFGPGRAARSGGGTATTVTTLIGTIPIVQTHHLLASFWEVGHMNGFAVCRLIPFVNSFQ